MNSQPFESDDSIIELEVDCSELKWVPMPLDGISRQKAEEYLEKLKKWRPEEYEQLMKQREEISKEREARKKQDPQ